jgi:hypothetical protein
MTTRGSVTRWAGRLAARAATVVTGTVALARLGLPALGLMLAAVVIAAVVTCWVLASEKRSGNAERLIRAVHPPPPLPPTPPATALSAAPPVTARRWRVLRRRGTARG